MPNLVPLRIKIGLRSNGHADHPDWTVLPAVPANVKNIERFLGITWFYDKTSGHDDDAAGSPEGSQLAVVLMTQNLAREAIDNLPAVYEATVLNDAQTEVFWDTKVTKHLAADLVDGDLLASLKTELDLRVALGQDVTMLSARIGMALDRNNLEPGVRKNEIKAWPDYKSKKNIRVVAPIL